MSFISRRDVADPKGSGEMLYCCCFCIHWHGMISCKPATYGSKPTNQQEDIGTCVAHMIHLVHEV